MQYKELATGRECSFSLWKQTGHQNRWPECFPSNNFYVDSRAVSPIHNQCILCVPTNLTIYRNQWNRPTCKLDVIKTKNRLPLKIVLINYEFAINKKFQEIIEFAIEMNDISSFKSSSDCLFWIKLTYAWQGWIVTLPQYVSKEKLADRANVKLLLLDLAPVSSCWDGVLALTGRGVANPLDWPRANKLSKFQCDTIRETNFIRI